MTDPGARNVLELSLANDLREISIAAARIDAICVQNGLLPEIALDINLTVDELLTNTITYGYDDDGEHLIELLFRFDGDEAMVQITDDGEPFDPLQVPDPDRAAPLESRAKGGLGVFLVRNVMDRVEYRRGDGCNIITLTKRAACTGPS
ncbi:MAG: ATP-binding protein [Chromatiales bacterium]|nr:ATP-binding protein [Chromatiales bacterium]